MPFKSNNISWFVEGVSGITIRPTAPTSPLKSMESPSHSISACRTKEENQEVTTKCHSISPSLP